MEPTSSLFNKNEIVKISYFGRERYAQVVNGPCVIEADLKRTNSPRRYYEGWLLVEKGSAGDEPSSVRIYEEGSIKATKQEIEMNTYGPLKLVESEF